MGEEIFVANEAVDFFGDGVALGTAEVFVGGEVET